MNLGNRLVELRKEKDMTQQMVADFINIDRSTYGKYERNSIEPSLSTLINLAALFEISSDYLLGIEE